MTAKPDHYTTLGIDRTADAAAIKSAYRKLALKFHPDSVARENPGASPEVLQKLGAAYEAKFKQVGEAYSILGDATKRTAYDRFGGQPFQGSASRGPQPGARTNGTHSSSTRPGAGSAKPGAGAGPRSHAHSNTGGFAGATGARPGTGSAKPGAGAHGFEAGTSAFDDIFDQAFGKGWRQGDFSGARENKKSTWGGFGDAKSKLDREFAKRQARYEQERAAREREFKKTMDDFMGGKGSGTKQPSSGLGKAEPAFGEHIFHNAAGEVHYGKVAGAALAAAAVGYGLYQLSTDDKPKTNPVLGDWTNRLAQLRMQPASAPQL